MSVYEPIQAFQCDFEWCDEGWHDEEPEKRGGWFVDNADLEEFSNWDHDAYLIPEGEGVTIKRVEMWIFSCGTRWVGPLEREQAWKCKECEQIVSDPEDGCGCA